MKTYSFYKNTALEKHVLNSQSKENQYHSVRIISNLISSFLKDTRGWLMVRFIFVFTDICELIIILIRSLFYVEQFPFLFDKNPTQNVQSVVSVHGCGSQKCVHILVVRCSDYQRNNNNDASLLQTGNVKYIALFLPHIKISC